MSLFWDRAKATLGIVRDGAPPSKPGDVHMVYDDDDEIYRPYVVTKTKAYARMQARAHFPILTGEVGVTDASYEWGVVERYGAVGDGATDDRAAILNAITSVAAIGGGVVRLRAKTYLISNHIRHETANNVRISGYGATLKASSAVANQDLRLGSSGAATVSNVVVEGLTIDLTLSAGTSATGVVLFVTKGALIQDVRVIGAKGNGAIQIIGPTNGVLPVGARVVRNRIESAAGHGIRIGANAPGTIVEGNTVVTVNTVDLGAGIYCESTDCVVRDNYIEDAYNNGIRFEAARCKAFGNRIVNVEDDGIRFSGDDCEAIGNEIDTDHGAATSVGIRIRDVARGIVKGNTIRGGIAQGIKVDNAGGVDPLDAVIVGNVIESCTSIAIQITGAGSGHVISANRCKGNGGNGIEGSSSATNVTVSGNICTGNTGYGIRTLNTCDRWNVTGNIALTNTVGQVSLVGANNVNANNIVA